MGRDTKPRIKNPYADAGTRWLCGEIHAHVCRASGSSDQYNGCRPEKLYRHADKFGLDFICMNVEVTEAMGGVDRFGDVESGSQYEVTGIPAREIQNNYYKNYFSESGACYLHVLTLGNEGGISICAHPRYYEVGNKKTRGQWWRIREALLNPNPGHRLEALNVCGIEVYCGYTLQVVKRDGRKEEYADYDEPCWDDLLMAGRRYWGFAGNDSFLPGEYLPQHFAHLGLVHVQVHSGAEACEILRALEAGRFYSSSGVRLACTPIEVSHTLGGTVVRVFAKTRVDWTAIVHEREASGWTLGRRYVHASKVAEFTVRGDWKYIRVRCEDIHNRWRRAWLQPITNDAFFGQQDGSKGS